MCIRDSGLAGFPITKTLHFGNIFWVHMAIFIIGTLAIALCWALDVYAAKKLPPEEIKLF